MIAVILSLTGNLGLGPYHDIYANARPPMGLGGDNYCRFIFASLFSVPGSVIIYLPSLHPLHHHKTNNHQ